MLYVAHLVGALLTALISAVVARWVRRQTRDRAGTVMIVLLGTHVVMGTSLAGYLLSPTPELKAFWFLLTYLFVLVNPVLWLLFAIYYTGREHWLTGSVWGALTVCVVAPAGLLLTNPFHELLVTGYRIEHDPFRHLVVETAGSNALLLALVHVNALLGFGLFFRTFLSSQRTARRQTAVIIFGMAAIVVPSIAVATDHVPLENFPYGVFGSGIFGVVVAVGLFRTQLFAVTPLARDALFESLEEGILVVDARLTIVDFNATASEFFPEIESRLGERLDDAYPALVDRDGATCDGGSEALVEVVERSSDSPFADSVQVSTDDGSRTLRIAVSEIASGGEPRGYGLILRDVTELETYAAELEHRTDQLERFAGALSHDLRNPVAVATGYVDHARETGDVEHLREAAAALEQIDETITDLLTLSREGAAIDDPVPISLRLVVADAWTTSDTDATVLENDLDGDDRIRADPSRLRTLLENLFRNAAEHGGERVRVGSLEGAAGFYVADDGPGIPADERGRVLEYGYTSAAEGTGIGLAIVASIATAHGWSLSVTEGERGGARFEVSGVERVPSADRSARDGPSSGPDR